MPKWTKAQQQAIDSRNGTILVSAAAGSGKTTVLVERVIQRLTDTHNPCSADRLLIVTFTKAATAQMKEKIAAALDKCIEQDPENAHLLRQRMLLPFAQISTIDSFCSQLVRENFQLLGISPDFVILEQSQLDLMMNDAVEKVIEEEYKNNSPEFRRLLDTLASSGNDSAVIDLILSLHNYSRAFPFPEKWLDKIVESYNEDIPVCESNWGMSIVDNIRIMLNHCIEMTSSAIEVIKNDDPEEGEKFEKFFDEYLGFFFEYISVLDTGMWDLICEFPSKFKPGRIPRSKSVYASRTKDIKSEIVDIITKRIPKLLCCNETEYKEDIVFLRPVVEKAVELVKRFNKEFTALKSASNGVDFNDVVDFSISLLVEGTDENDNPVKTELAETVSQQFDEILIDEFQDINETQNLLFKAVSNDERNLFMVGDVKQSIYRFRQAMPEIFLNRRENLEFYNDENYPAKINLDYNFRSRKGVTDFVNFVFSQIMSKTAGELDYDQNEELKSKAAYSEKDVPDAEIHIVSDTSGKTDVESEARYIADYIRKTMESGFTVQDKAGERPVEYKDFCILMRSPKNKASVYAQVFARSGIPCHVTSTNGFFDSTEIRTILSIIKTVDNPHQDIPLIAAMLSPSFGFTPDELAGYRVEKRGSSYYNCVRNAARNGSKKCKAFLECLEKLRTFSVTLGVGDFLRELLDITGYDSLVCAMPNGSQRRANVNLLVDYAEKYEKSGHVGVSGFVRFIERVEKQQGDMEIANEISENADIVRIMSIHKSKGLEFPVCIVADCSGKFNDYYLRGNSVINPKYGLAFRRVESYRKFDTLPFKAIQLEEERASRSEELRVLYVALTRAKECLVCVVRNNNALKTLEKLPGGISANGISPYKVINSKSFSDWLLLACASHPDFAPLVPSMPYINFDADFMLKGDVHYFSEEVKVPDDDKKTPEIDDELLLLLKNRLSYSYPYGDLSDIVAKVSPSNLDDAEASMQYFASSKPGFALIDGTDSASKGTAMHKFMEFYDYSGPMDVKAQAELMVKNKKLSVSEEKALDYKSLSLFFLSDIAREIAASPNLLREKKVTITVPASEIYPDLIGASAEETVLVQGYIDCAFMRDGKWIIVDYKTDRVKSIEILRSRYINQLKMYEKALSQCTGIPVECTIIYSLYLGEAFKL